MTLAARALHLVILGAALLACASAWSDEAAIRKNWALRNPKAPAIDEITKTPIAGLYELRIDREIVYSDDQGNYMIYPSRDQTDGHLLDTRSRTDLTEQRLARMMAQDLPKLPYADALVFKQGNGARHLVVFEDPNCHFCRDAERNFVALKDVTIHTFLIPILGPDSIVKARAIWCAKNNAQAWRSWMIQGESPLRTMGPCDVAALSRNLDLAGRYHLNYTPAIILDDGSHYDGVVELDKLSKRLDEVAAKKG